jgi:hypothetical protein
MAIIALCLLIPLVFYFNIYLISKNNRNRNAIDFFLENGYEHHVIFQENCKCVGPKFIGFKKGKPVAGTGLRPPGITGKEKFCYCLEGITEIIYLTDPSLFE